MPRPGTRVASAALAAGLALSIGGAAEPTAESIHQRVEKVKNSEPTAWKKIPWVASLLEARRVSQDENHPVFLFTHDGNLETGRC
jgi:hypothetical protein